jgi:hypothetical protein
MPRVSAEAIINAPADAVYAVIADYRDGHPRILPKPPFVSLDVEEGGIGAGTVIRCRMRMMGRTQEFRATVTEPEPGKLVETIAATGMVTSFTVDSAIEKARVTISTDFKARGGLLGRVERFFITRALRPVYVREIALLEAVAAKRL